MTLLFLLPASAGFAQDWNRSIDIAGPPGTPAVHDPASFTMVGVKLYMPFDAAVRTLEERYHVKAKRSEDSRVFLDGCASARPLLYMRSGPTDQNLRSEGAQVVFCNASGTVLLEFAPGLHMGERTLPPMLEEVIYRGGPSPGDERIFHDAAMKRYGDPTHCTNTGDCVWMQDASARAGVPYASVVPNANQPLVMMHYTPGRTAGRPSLTLEDTSLWERRKVEQERAPTMAPPQF